MSGRLACSALTLMSCALFSISADAAGFMVRENSADSIGMSYAGAASRADSAETAFSNPAGLTGLSRDEVELGAAVVIPEIKFKGSASALGTPIAGNNVGNSGHILAVPNAYGSFSISPDLKAGIALTAPFGNSLAYDSNWVGRYLATKTAMSS